MIVTLYTKADCPGCVAAGVFLADKGVEFTVVDLTRDDIGQQDMWSRGLSFPCLRIDDRWVGGFSYGTWQKALREALTDD